VLFMQWAKKCAIDSGCGDGCDTIPLLSIIINLIT
jgi:hypothetical protein